ncbi:MAG: hypothetical protein ACO1TE_16420 [Prosthecobacter sp.]
MNFSLSRLASVIACCALAACQSGGGSKDGLTARLEIRAPFESIVYQLKDRACSVQEVGHNGRILHESQRTLTHEEAASFWAALEQMQVRQWRRDYGATAGDGRNPVTAWKLVTRLGRSSTSSQGIGAFPSDERPNAPSTDTSTRFQNVYALFQGTVSPQSTEVAANQVPKALPAEDGNAVR